MTKKNIKAKATGDLESRVTALEARMAVLEQLARKVVRRKRDYTDEERAAIRARLLAGQEAARKQRENEAKAKVTEKTESSNTNKPKKVIETEKSNKAEPVLSSESS